MKELTVQEAVRRIPLKRSKDYDRGFSDAMLIGEAKSRMLKEKLSKRFLNFIFSEDDSTETT